MAWTPPRSSSSIVFQEPQIEVEASVASSSQAAQAWQPKFQLDDKPLPTSTCVWVWDKGERGRVAQSLVHGLFLPKGVHAFEEETEEYIGRKLQWHTIAVILHLLIPY